MKPLSIFSIFILILAFQTPGQSNVYYLLFDNACMDRLEYVYPETKPGNEFIVYSFKRSPTERWILEVGAESQSIQQYAVPTGMITCAASGLFEDGLINSLNEKSDQLFIVRPAEDGQYRLSLVKQAFRFIHRADQLSIETSEYRLTCNPSAPEMTGDLSQNDARGKVFFIQKNADQTVWTFRQVQLKADDYLEIKVAPSIGILEEKYSRDGMTFVLQNINNSPLRMPSAPVVSSVANPGWTEKGVTPPTALPSSFEWKEPTQSKSPVTTPPTHTVAKGESLYSISRKYATRVADLQRWNNLGNSTLIQPGMVLMVAENSAAVTDIPTSFEQASDQTPRSVVPQAYPAPAYAWLSASAEVVVAAGETVASLAARYGYSEERFRYFNRLSPNAVLKVGDVIKTSDCEPADLRIPDEFDQFSEKGIPRTTPATETESALIDPYWGEFTPTNKEEIRDQPAKQTADNKQPAAGYFGPVRTETTPAAQNSDSPTAYEYTDVTPKSASTRKADKQRKVHEVKAGETLGDIARRYGLTEEALRKLNNLNAGEAVIPFQRIFIN